MRLAIPVINIKIESNPLLKSRYRNRLRSIRELADIFQELKDAFTLANPKRRFDRIVHLSWQIFIGDAYLLKYEVPLDTNINNAIP